MHERNTGTCHKGAIVMFRDHLRTLLAFGPLSLAAVPATAADLPARSLELGARLGVLVGDGEPANDMPSYGLVARYHLSTAWAIGFSFDQSDFDFERPAAILGITQSSAVEDIDSKVSHSIVSLWLERDVGKVAGWEGFGQLGTGFAWGDASNASGPTTNGGRFDIQTDTGTTGIAFGALGVRRRIGEHWQLEGTLRMEYQSASYELQDQVSGARGSVGSFVAYGGQLCFTYRF